MEVWLLKIAFSDGDEMSDEVFDSKEEAWSKAISAATEMVLETSLHGEQISLRANFQAGRIELAECDTVFTHIDVVLQ